MKRVLSDCFLFILSASIKCCRFHLWVKHSGGRSKLSGLVLITKTTRVEPTEVEDCFTEDIMPDCPDEQNCNEFADYLLENYVTFDSKFTPDMWAGIPSEENRNNNGTESFHTHINEQIYASHPTIFIFNELYLAVPTFTYLNYP